MAAVLDTSAILARPELITEYPKVVLPAVVLQELGDNADKWAAREFNRNMMQASYNACDETFKLKDTTITIMPGEFEDLSPDNQILRVAEACGCLITLDVNLTLKCKSLGIPVEAPKANEIDSHREVYVPSGTDKVFNGGLSFDGYENEYLTLKSQGQSALVRVQNGYALPLSDRNTRIKPRTREQAFAQDALMEPSIEMVALTGVAGTGKTLLSLAAGLQQQREGLYSKVTIIRPIVTLGNELGYLPGDLDQKLSPWEGSIKDNVSKVIEPTMETGLDGPLELLKNSGIIEFAAVPFIRGRSLSDQFIIVDEAQNLTAGELKTIITRAATGSKIVLAGDVDQCDLRHGGGLESVIDKLTGSELFARVHLAKTERSPLAELAAKVL